MKYLTVLIVILLVGLSTNLFGQTEILPDFRPIWSTLSLGDIAIDTARDNDRLVSCDDWTVVDPTPITGQRVLSFTLSSPNFGRGHFRTRREATDRGWVIYQTTSLLNDDGTCSSIEDEIAVVPADQAQERRWLPLAKFTLYEVAEDGGVGPALVCQMKRWCCLLSKPICNINAPCSLPCDDLGGCIDAGARDLYTFHWQDQFIPIEGIPSGVYWVEHVINPANVLIESNYDNNSMLFMIELNQEAGTVRVVQEPKDPGCP